MRELMQFYINGEWVDPATPNSLDVINPANEEVCAQISMGSEEDVNRAVAAAKAAFPSFSRTSVKERVELLESCAEVYQKYYNDIAEAIPGWSHIFVANALQHFLADDLKLRLGTRAKFDN